MALIRAYTIAGIEVPNAYYVITGLQATKRLVDVVVTPPVMDGDNVVTPGFTTVTPSQMWDCNLIVSVFKDKARRDAGDSPLAYLSDATPTTPFTTSFAYDSESNVLPVVAGYQHLMAQDYFTGATVDTTS